MRSRKMLLLAAFCGWFSAPSIGLLWAQPSTPGTQQPTASVAEYFAGLEDEQPAESAPDATDSAEPGVSTVTAGSNSSPTCTDGLAPCFSCPSPSGCATPCNSFCQMVGRSMFSDVYATPSQWRPLTLGTLFSEGWNESWISPVNGSGGAPRQGWINAQDGVFYRLAFTGFTERQGLATGGNQYLGYTTIFAPVSRRFEVRVDVPWLASNPAPSGGNYRTNFGNLTIYPRLLLHETQDTSVVFEVPVRCGTGSTVNANGYSSVAPNVSFWRNVKNGWVVRGGVGATVPTSSSAVPVRTTADAYFSVGNYITPHDALPFGDFVYYVSTILHTTVDGRNGPSYTYVSLTPGFRCHIGDNWYALGGVEVPVGHPFIYHYAPTTWLMKVF